MKKKITIDWLEKKRRATTVSNRNSVTNNKSTGEKKHGLHFLAITTTSINDTNAEGAKGKKGKRLRSQSTSKQMRGKRKKAKILTPEQQRMNRNSQERKRQRDLSQLFSMLREVITPFTNGHIPTTKYVILHETINSIHKLVEDNLALNQTYKKKLEVLLSSSSSSSVQKSEKSHTAMPASVSNKNKKHPKEILQMNEPLHYSEEKMAQGQKKLLEMRRKLAFKEIEY